MLGHVTLHHLNLLVEFLDLLSFVCFQLVSIHVRPDGTRHGETKESEYVVRLALPPIDRRKFTSFIGSMSKCIALSIHMSQRRGI